ncbi:MAG: DegV family protein [Bacilli bacterium]
MKKFEIISDGSCDIGVEEAKKLDIKIVNFTITFSPEKSYVENEDLLLDDFYNQIVINPSLFPTTSCPSPYSFYEKFLSSYKEGLPVLCICISRKFSGSYSSALVAKDQLLEEYPDAKVEVLDSRCNTVLQGLFVKEAVRMRELGKTFEEVVNCIKEAFGSRIFFTVSNLKYLEHGGRIGKLSSLIGGILQLNPIIILKHGEIFSGGIALKRKRALKNIVDKVGAYFEKNNLNFSDYRFVVGYCINKDESLALIDELNKKYNIDCELSRIGATIAVHTGPDAIGIGFVRKFDHILQTSDVKNISFAKIEKENI